ncbi:GIY-YIG nuclease family protein [Falsigemmobacter faecalis]|uniref:GIY-YIG nuclease family protein n=1 Tax=Falsigemmobacter faecalis TaxID=2488730 RepID=A0A3P3DUG3_9RHOB|nr:GIY-YIG nuclease family protein [Falsigemmobacter faecalis]RRH77386.1 GIY-YIG nuclease family protein [Falsigemmobacter faecalis]
MSAHGRSVRLFLDNGKVTGLVTAEIMNWTGIILTGPRALLPLAVKQYPLACTGVYLLRGDSDESGLPQIYVGETDDFARRMTEHEPKPNMEFWTHFTLIFSKDPYLTKAHVTWLEAELISGLREARLCTLSNGNDGRPAKLPAADLADMRTFFEEVRLLLPVIGFDLLRMPLAAPPAQGTGTNPSGPAQTTNLPQTETDIATLSLIMRSNTMGIAGKALETADEFVVLADSIGTLQMLESFSPALRLRRVQALETGLITPVGQTHFRLTGNMSFKSPSAASQFLWGTSRNGKTDWLPADSGTPYGTSKSLQRGGLAKSAEGAALPVGDAPAVSSCAARIETACSDETPAPFPPERTTPI